MDLTTRVIAIIAKELGEQHLTANRVSSIQPTHLLEEDVGVNSIDRVCIAVALDEAFGIEVSDDDVGSWNSVSDVVASVAKLGAKVEGAAHG
jgi:acyl carrier protein